VVGNLEQGGAVFKHKVVDALCHQYPIVSLCKYLGISKSGYYKYRNRKDTDRDQMCKEQIQTIYDEREGPGAHATITCCHRLAPKSACHDEAIV
jgi:putative transposase